MLLKVFRATWRDLRSNAQHIFQLHAHVHAWFHAVQDAVSKMPWAAGAGAIAVTAGLCPGVADLLSEGRCAGVQTTGQVKHLVLHVLLYKVYYIVYIVLDYTMFYFVRLCYNMILHSIRLSLMPSNRSRSPRLKTRRLLSRSPDASHVREALPRRRKTDIKPRKSKWDDRGRDQLP